MKENVKVISEMAVETLSASEIRKLVKVLTIKADEKSNDAVVKAAEAKVAKMLEEAARAKESLKALKANKSTRIAKISASQTGRKWCNNGIEEMRVYELPEGFEYGRIKKHSITKAELDRTMFHLQNKKVA